FYFPPPLPLPSPSSPLSLLLFINSVVVMSPLLAALALLALCWQPSTGVSWTVESLDYQNLVSYISKEEQSQVGASIKAHASIGSGRNATPEQLVQMFNMMPNTLMMMGLRASGAMANVTFLHLPLVNGALCELEDPKLPEALNRVLYNGSQPSAEDKQQLAAMMKNEFNVDCAAKPPTASFANLSALTLRKAHSCFCAEARGAVCLPLMAKFMLQAESEEKNITLTTSACINETLPALLNAGSGALGAAWKDLETSGPETFNDAISGNVDAFASADKAQILCDAVNPDVEKAFKAVYLSNGVHWLAESLIFAKAFGPQEPTETEKTLAEVCSEGALRENAYGKCVCQQDSGFIYCIYKVFAESFISEGFLTCDKTDNTKQKFEKIPAALPQLAGVKAKPDSKGPTGGSASSSLTIASLAAAALLLLRL
ncbi:hypothetical protein PRIPAC_95050, partial [Pristionchus pacificus]